MRTWPLLTESQERESRSPLPSSTCINRWDWRRATRGSRAGRRVPSSSPVRFCRVASRRRWGTRSKMMLGEPAIGRLTPVAGSLLFLLVAALPAQDSTFLLSTTDPAYRIPAFIGNGAFSLVSTALGTTPAASYAAGVYDHFPGDVARLAELPAWNAFDVSDGAAWLNAVTSTLVCRAPCTHSYWVCNTPLWRSSVWR